MPGIMARSFVTLFFSTKPCAIGVMIPIFQMKKPKLRTYYSLLIFHPEFPDAPFLLDSSDFLSLHFLRQMVQHFAVEICVAAESWFGSKGVRDSERWKKMREPQATATQLFVTSRIQPTTQGSRVMQQRRGTPSTCGGTFLYTG